MRRRLRTAFAFVFLGHLLFTAGGCSIEYYDAHEGVEHVWGITHMAMKTGKADDGLKAVGHRTDIAGLSLGKGPDGYHLDLGWSSYQQIDIVDQNTQLCLAWPAGSFYQARVGSQFPPDVSSCGSERRENK
jgi:hypothetical protein